MRRGLRTSAAVCAALVMAAVAGAAAASTKPGDWAVYGGDAGGQRYSPLAQVNRGNVAGLAEAWRYDAGYGGLQTSPIAVDGVVYVVATDQSVAALDAASGRQLWRFSSGSHSQQPARGVTLWSSGAERRLFVSAENSLYALDPATGRPIPTFGTGGHIDLREGLGRDPAGQAVFLTTPGAVFEDLLITGFRTTESPPAAPGDIRAYDVRTGKLRWSFHTIPHPGEPGAETWPADAWKVVGGANAWAGLAVDAKRGIVYAPTGSAVFDFWGGDRTGDNLYANTLLALDARTGRRLWHFQGVRHDVWDRDFPSPPTLLTVRRDGRAVDAVAQTTKQGVVFVFDRATGKPLFPIAMRPTPKGEIDDDPLSAAQPWPIKPAPFARQDLTEALLTERTPEAHAAVLARFRAMRSEGPFAPWSLTRDTLVFPGFDGGAEWGGSAADPARGVLYVNANDIPWYSRLNRADPTLGADRGARVYAQQCALCHGPDRKGAPDMPALTDVGARLFDGQIAQVIVGGRGRMPGFPQLAAADRTALIAFLRGEAAPAGDKAEAVAARGQAMPYAFGGYRKFQDPDGYPAVKPPWGTLNAIDLNTGDYLWTVPLGEYPELAAKGQGGTGSENYGGPIVTAGGLVFIGATIYDRKVRAFDSRTGRLLWQADLPFAGSATPITYAAGGRQFVLIATSGARNPKGPQGSAYVAFALPDKNASRGGH